MPRAAPRLGAVLLAVCALLAGLAGQARGQEDGEALRGTLSHDDEPVSGVEVTVVDADGEEVGTAVSDDDGEWEVPLPGPGTYTATLDEETLPEDVGLRDPDRATLEVSVRSGRARTLLFALGEHEDSARVLLGRVSQNLLNGVKFGLIIAMTAIGLSLVFGTIRLINFAHGDMVTFGAVAAYFLNAAGPRLPLVAAAALAVLIGALLGFVLERGLWRPLRERRAGLVQLLVISVGVALVLRHLILIVFAGRPRRYTDFAIQQSLEFGPLRVTPRDLAVMAISLLVLTLVGLMLQRTRIGKAIRAVADNRELAESSGVDVQRVILYVWLLGGGLAALGGVLNGVVENVHYLMGFRLLLLMFAGVILGGIGTAFGAFVGSLIVGIITELSTLYFSPDLKFMWALAVMALVLLVRPQGIFGVRERVG